MKLKDIKKEIKGVFKLPKKRYYLGKLKYALPYMYPRGFSSTILSVRKLKLKTEEELQKYNTQYPHFAQSKEDRHKFSNLPMVRRCKDWVIKLFGNYYWIELGWPISIKNLELGYKWKYDFVRYEWNPSFQINFFNWQFCIFWEAPDGHDDLYYEMIIWYLHCDKDIIKAESEWGWADFNTKESTWNKKYLIHES